MKNTISLPEHKCSLHIDHNNHTSYYMTAKDQIEEWSKNEHGGSPEWRDQESMNRAAETGEIWTMQWYPETPIGFHYVAAPSLAELLDFAASIEISPK